MNAKFWFWAWSVVITVSKSAPDSIGNIWENLLIIHASDEEEAFTKAEAFGRQAEGDSSGSLKLDGKPAETLFLGISDIGVIHEGLVDGSEILFRERRGFRRTVETKLPGKESLVTKLKQELRYAKIAGGLPAD